jgi:phosphoglycolate phosphatase-like HAD superfamily hydrolase
LLRDEFLLKFDKVDWNGDKGMKPISVVIMDLDDTVWDWVGIWHASFTAMLDRLELDSGIPRETLIKDFKSVFQKHGTTEYAFAIEELPSLQEKHKGKDLTIVYKDAIKAYRCARSKVLCIYPTVRETLDTLRNRGVLLAAYTESMSFYTRSRLRKLDLDKALDYLYAPQDHAIPENIDVRKIRRYPPGYYCLRGVIHHFTPANKLKPAPEVLRTILDDIGVTPDRAIYVGDKLNKDVLMAQRAGVIDVWAKYGEAKDRPEYELLRKVTHWSNKAVQEEKNTSVEDAKPTFVLRDYFAELLEYFEFTPFVDSMSTDKFKSVVEVWKKTIDVQQHFNDIELRIRNFAITILLAAIGAAGFALKENLKVSLIGLEIPLASILMLAGALALLPLWFMDRHWYHRLLYGAVRHASIIEERHKRFLPEMGLSQRISDESPVKLWRWELHTTRKLDLFYLIIGVLLVVGAIGVWFCKPTSLKGSVTKTPTQMSASENVGVEHRFPQLKDINDAPP